ncbi:MAG: 2-hydroxyacyl-CoA dehydratase family protein [Chloroflexota bacterium]
MTIKEGKKRPINRLKTMYSLRAKVDESYKRSVEAMKSGKPTVWSMLNWWEGDVIMKAMDLEMVYPENFGAVCAAQGVAPTYLDRADTDGFPTHLCGYSRNSFGYASRMMKELKGEIPPEAPMGGMPRPVLLLASNVICDARYKWFQSLGLYMNTPVWLLEMPIPGVKELFLEGVYDRYVGFVVSELREFITFLERLLGKKMDWDRLDEMITLTEQICRVWHNANELRKVKPCPVHSRDFWSAMTPALFLLGDLKDTLKCYQDLYNEVKERVDNHVSGILSEEKYRLMFSEIPPWHTLGFFDKLAERGWNFVIESWGYHPPIPIDLTKISDPLERLARFCLQFNVGYYQDALKEGETYGYHAYPHFAYGRDWKIDGAFFHPLITCRSASNHLPTVREMLLQKLSIPSLMIEGDLVDLRLFDPVDALNKAEPFEQTMDHYKEERKKRGLDW